MEPLNLAVIVKLEPDFSEGNVSYKPDGTLNRNETKSTLGPHSGIQVRETSTPSIVILLYNSPIWVFDYLKL